MLTARGAAVQSLASSFEAADQVVSLTGAEAAADAASRSPEAAYVASISGNYARSLSVSIAQGEDPPPSDNGAARLGLGATWTTGPLSSLTLDTGGFIASRFGIRAQDPLADRDPFLRDRTLYAFNQGVALGVQTSALTSLVVGGGYAQAGAVAADAPEAVGIDTHAGSGRLGLNVQVSRRTSVGPQLSYVYTHFYNALLDVNLSRGPADVHAGTGLFGVNHDVARAIKVQVAGGGTVASPPPILGSEALVIAPEVRLGASWLRRRSKLSGNYSYAYTSLGPRIGFGSAHGANLELATKPLGGAKYRDFVLKGIGRFSYGSAPVAANPPLDLPPGTPTPTGTVTSTGGAAGVAVDYPILRGLAMTAGFDLEYVRATFDPEPPVPLGSSSLRALWTVGLAGIVSTDKANTVRRDPDEEDGDDRSPVGVATDDRRPDRERDQGEAARDGDPAAMRERAKTEEQAAARDRALREARAGEAARVEAERRAAEADREREAESTRGEKPSDEPELRPRAPAAPAAPPARTPEPKSKVVPADDLEPEDSDAGETPAERAETEKPSDEPTKKEAKRPPQVVAGDPARPAPVPGDDIYE